MNITPSSKEIYVVYDIYSDSNPKVKFELIFVKSGATRPGCSQRSYPKKKNDEYLKDFPHAMPTTQAETIIADLVAY